jgi:hypothetical protein
LYRPGANNTSSQYSSTKSTEPLATDLSIRDSVATPLLNASVAEYGQGIFYNDTLYAHISTQYPYYYYTPTGNTIVNNTTYAIQGNLTLA